MIYTITFNPAIDYVINNDEVNINSVNKIDEKYLLAGGKGVNASVLLTRLGIINESIVFTGGNTGRMFESILNNENVNYTSFDSGFDTRINVKVNTSKNNFELNGKKEELDKDSVKKFLKYLKNKVNTDDFILIMGSFPSDELLDKVIKISNKKNAKVVLDVDSKNILNIIKDNEIFFIKPNEDEIKNMVNTEGKSEKIIKESMKKVIELGVQNIMVSLGEKGSLFMNKDKYYKVKPAKIDMVNPVGSGDSTVAGFVYSLSLEKSIEEAIIFANACGAATASKVWISDKETVESLVSSISIK